MSSRQTVEGSWVSSKEVRSSSPSRKKWVTVPRRPDCIMWDRPLPSHTAYNRSDQGPNYGVENGGVVVSEQVNFMRTLGAENSVEQFSDLHTQMCDSASRIDIFPPSPFTNILLMYVCSTMESGPKARQSHCAQTKAIQQTVPEELEHSNIRWWEMCHTYVPWLTASRTRFTYQM